MATCRFCKMPDFDKAKYSLVKYGVRHYAHADCGLKNVGAAFFDRLSPWQLSKFPVFAAKDFGLTHELERRYAEVKHLL